MRVTLPLLRIAPARAPVLRYGVAVLSTTLALIPAVLLPNITESRLAVFAVAVMVVLALAAILTMFFLPGGRADKYIYKEEEAEEKDQELVSEPLAHLG